MSRTHHARIKGTHRAGHAQRSHREHGKGNYVDYGTPPARLECLPDAKRAAIAEGLADAEVEYVEPRGCEADYNEALSLNELASWERDLLLGVEGATAISVSAWSSEYDNEFVQNELERKRMEDAEYDGGYGGYSDDPDWGDYDGCWMPFMRGAQEMGELFEHGYHVITTNVVRTSALHYTEKERNMKDQETERLQALMAAQTQRERHERMAAQLHADDKAKVTRPLPVPHAEHKEPSPYDRFSGRYNEALDPISPNFDEASW